MAEKHRGRPRKSEAEKRRPVTINVTRAEFDAACAVARVQREPVAVTLRDMIVSRLHEVAR